MSGTIWVSKTPMAATRNVQRDGQTAGLRFAGWHCPESPSRCSVPPGRRCSWRGQLRVDHRLAGRPRAVHLALHDLDPVSGYTQGAVRAGPGVHQFRHAVARREPYLVQDRRRDGCHLREPAQRGVIPGEPGARGDDVDLGDVRPAEQAGVGGVGTAGAGDRGQHHCADDAQEQRQARQRPPPQPEVRAQPQPDRCHRPIQSPAWSAVKDAGITARGRTAHP